MFRRCTNTPDASCVLLIFYYRYKYKLLEILEIAHANRKPTGI